MELEEFIWLLPYIFIFSTSLILGLLFFTVKSKNKRANIFLSLFLWSIAIQFLNDILNEMPFEEEFGFSLFIVEPFLFSLPLLFIYLLSTINREIKRWYYFLFIPGIFHNILLHFNESFIQDSLFTTSELFIYFMEILLLIYAYRILRTHNEGITHYYSELENRTLIWLKSIFALNIIIHFLSIATFLFDLSAFQIIEYSIDVFSLGLVIVMIFWIAHNGFSQPEMFKRRLFTDIGDTFKNSDSEEIQNTSKGDILKFNEIKAQIQKRELFINPKLNLRLLSEELELKEKELSRLINIHEKMNFYQFINEFRIEKFKKLIQSPDSQQYSIMGLANKAGFNSKSTFYTAFKSIDGTTPSQYQKEINKS